MAPLVSAFLGALGIGTGYVLYKEFTKKPTAPPVDLPGIAKMRPVGELTKGAVYNALAVFDWRTAIPAQQITIEQGAAFIKASFESVGFVMMTDPKPKDEANARAFFAGNQSQWTFNVQWTKEAKTPELTDALKKAFPAVAFFSAF